MHLVHGLQWSIPMQLPFESSCPSLFFLFYVQWWVLCQSICIAENKNQNKTNPKVAPVHTSSRFSCIFHADPSCLTAGEVCNYLMQLYCFENKSERTFHHIQWSAWAEQDINAALSFMQGFCSDYPMVRKSHSFWIKGTKHLLRCTSKAWTVESFGPNITCKINIINGDMRQPHGMYFWIRKMHANWG